MTSRRPNRLVAAVLAGAAMIGGAAIVGRAAPETKDWPTFRGPARDNISKETGLLKEWPEGGPPLAWKATGVGGGFSSVSVANGKIFTAGDVGDEAVVLALNEADGKILWKSKLGETGGGSGYPGPRATPTVDGDSVYMIGQYSDVVAYAAADGKELWRKNLNKDFKGRMMSGWGNSESLLVDGDNVICTPGGSGGTVLALNKKTGETVWRSKDFTDAAAYASPFVADVHGTRQLIIFTDKSVAGLNPKDGAVYWRITREGKTAVIPTPVVHNNHVFVSSGYGVGCDLFKINKAGDAFAAEKVYSNKAMVNHHGGVVLLDGFVYGYSDGKGWTCMDFMTGDVKWKDKDVLAKGTISYADGRLYCRAESGKGTVVLMEAKPDAMVEKGRFDQPDRTKSQAWPHLVIANGKLYVRDQQTLLCYDVKAK